MWGGDIVSPSKYRIFVAEVHNLMNDRSVRQFEAFSILSDVDLNSKGKTVGHMARAVEPKLEPETII